MRKSLLCLALALTASPSMAGNYVMDADTAGYAGAAVATADFTSAGFYNPALLAFGNQGKRFGVLFPTLGVRSFDPDRLVNKLEDFAANYTNPNQAEVASKLRAVQNKQAQVGGGMAGSAGIATSNISGLFFISSYSEGLVFSEVSDQSIASVASGAPLAATSVLGQALSANVIDIGIALATTIALDKAPIAIGITPKIQQIYTYYQPVEAGSFDLSNLTDTTNRTRNSTLNLDLGLAWQRGAFQAGLAAKNLFRKELQTLARTYSYRYEVNPVYTVGAAFSQPKYILSADFDLNKQKRMSANSGPAVNDDIQLFRLGGRYQLTSDIQLKAGFIHDTQHSLDNIYTLGLGVGIWDSARVDFAAELIEQNSYGLLIQLSFTI